MIQHVVITQPSRLHSGTFRLPTPTACTRHTASFSLPSSHVGLSISPAVTSKVPLLPPHPVLVNLEHSSNRFHQCLGEWPCILGRVPCALLKQWKVSPQWELGPCSLLGLLCKPTAPRSICCLAEEQRSLLRRPRAWSQACW